ncbi:MAG: ankyrin repeat domain-containing protein [Treponema sp.]|nr:ankyrin repeat domain-containing protein [Treponema sp.]
MKKVSFFSAPLIILMAIALLAADCKSTPEEEPVDTLALVFKLLSSGDNSARSYFMGEIDVNAVDPDGKTPLHYAAERRDAQLASFFLALGANPNVFDNEGQSPLGICIENGDPTVAQVLTAGGANIHQQIPAYDNSTAAVLSLARGSSLFRSILTPNSIDSSDNSGKTVLHMAAISGNQTAVSEALSIISTNPALINKKDNDDKTALDYAFERTNSRNHFAIAEQLILLGGVSENPIFNYFGPAVRSANYNIRRNEGITPIHYAVIDNYTGLIIFLLEKKVNLNVKSTSGATALHEAVRIGNIDIITMLLDNSADVNAKDARGNTPLHTGIPPNVYNDVATMLLARGADPNLRDDHGDTPLHIAITLNRSEDGVRALLKGGADVHIRNINGKTPLYLAVQDHRTALIPILLANGSEIFADDNSGTTPFDISAKANDGTFNLLITPETVIQRDSSGNTMLHSAVRNRANSEQIAKILEQRALVDARNRDGETALHIAVRLNQRESGEFLVSRNANIFALNAAGQSPLYLALGGINGMREWMVNSTTIQARDGLGNTMLHYAAEWGFNNAISLIIRSGIPVDTPNATGQTPLFYAIKSDSPSTIRVFIDNNANLNTRDTQGNSVLHASVRWNAIISATFLLSAGIDINGHSLNGNTALHDAVILGMSEIETLLIRQKANLEVRNMDGNTPLMEAVRGGLIPSIEKLTQNKADTSTRNTRGDTPLHIAVGMERMDLVNMLLKTGVSIHARNTRNRTPFQVSLSISTRMVSTLLEDNRINIPDDFGNSALHVALLERADNVIIRTIVNQGGRINTVDSNGKTPLRLAVDMDMFESAKIIAEAGADPFQTAVDNKSPAEIAFTKGEDCIRALFSGRAINSRDSSGNTILHLAARYGTPNLVSVLLEMGANRSIRNVALESPNDIALRFNRNDNSSLLR